MRFGYSSTEQNHRINCSPSYGHLRLVKHTSVCCNGNVSVFASFWSGLCLCVRVCVRVHCICIRAESKVRGYIFAHPDRKKTWKSLASQLIIHGMHICIPSSSLSLFFWQCEYCVCACILLSSCVSVSAIVKQHFMHVRINHWTTIFYGKTIYFYGSFALICMGELRKNIVFWTLALSSVPDFVRNKFNMILG